MATMANRCMAKRKIAVPQTTGALPHPAFGEPRFDKLFVVKKKDLSEDDTSVRGPASIHSWFTSSLVLRRTKESDGAGGRQAFVGVLGGPEVKGILALFQERVRENSRAREFPDGAGLAVLEIHQAPRRA